MIAGLIDLSAFYPPVVTREGIEDSLCRLVLNMFLDASLHFRHRRKVGGAKLTFETLARPSLAEVVQFSHTAV